MKVVNMNVMVEGEQDLMFGLKIMYKRRTIYVAKASLSLWITNDKKEQSAKRKQVQQILDNDESFRSKIINNPSTKFIII